MSRHTRQAHYPTGNAVLYILSERGGGWGYGQDYGYVEPAFQNEDFEGFGSGASMTNYRRRGLGWVVLPCHFSMLGDGFGDGSGWGYRIWRSNFPTHENGGGW